VLADLALAQELADSEVVLYDIDAEKAELMAATGGSERIACEGVRGSG
jgi:alpha-galactosidase/6-phospho-beta-glucosidase family protein